VPHALQDDRAAVVANDDDADDAAGRLRLSPRWHRLRNIRNAAHSAVAETMAISSTTPAACFRPSHYEFFFARVFFRNIYDTTWQIE
jgi:hypothetical protein